MCINVYANGIGKGKGTHISVYAYLMRGENDDHLPWPFTGTVVIELLNQLEDRNHHSMRIPFPSDLEISQRVIDEERGRGYGYQKYISHSSLDYVDDEYSQTEFLKNDCLFFSVDVRTPSSKPWLATIEKF